MNTDNSSSLLFKRRYSKVLPVYAQSNLVQSKRQKSLFRLRRHLLLLCDDNNLIVRLNGKVSLVLAVDSFIYPCELVFCY